MRQPQPNDAPPVDTWERDWRGEVMRQLREMDEARQAAASQQAAQQQSNAVILERHLARLDEHDRRITTLEARPERQRAAVAQVGGLWTQIVYVGLALAAILISAASHISIH